MNPISRIILFCILTLLVFQQTAFCQDIQICGTDEYEKARIQENPDLLKAKEVMEKDFLDLNKNGGLNLMRIAASSEEIMKIPVVFHIIDIPNFDLTRLDKQIDILNNSFRKIEDTRIEFCIATKDNNGSNLAGGAYNYIVSDKTKWDAVIDDNTLKGLIHWDPNKFLNVYIVHELYNGDYKYDGYSTYPWEDKKKPELSGCVVDITTFAGSSLNFFKEGLTLVHEVGHWLGLYHPFQNGMNRDETDCKNDDPHSNGDLIADTPPCTLDNDELESIKTQTCSQLASRNTCIETDPNPNDNILITDKNDPIDNYMHYTNELCKNTFTWLQAGKMQYYLKNNRKSIITDNPASCPSHCDNQIQDIDLGETGVDCGGVDCDPCPIVINPGGIGPSTIDPLPIGAECVPNDPMPPYFTNCGIRTNIIYIFNCLEGELGGDTRNLYSFNYVIGTDNFRYGGGRLRIVADNWACPDAEYDNANNLTSKGNVVAGKIILQKGFKFISEPSKPQNSIEFRLANLYPKGAGDFKCGKNTSDQCPFDRVNRFAKPLPNLPLQEQATTQDTVTIDNTNKVISNVNSSEENIYISFNPNDFESDKINQSFNVDIVDVLGRKKSNIHRIFQLNNENLLLVFPKFNFTPGVYFYIIHLNEKMTSGRFVVY